MCYYEKLFQMETFQFIKIKQDKLRTVFIQLAIYQNRLLDTGLPAPYL
jgi:hypothetical protein